MTYGWVTCSWSLGHCDWSTAFNQQNCQLHHTGIQETAARPNPTTKTLTVKRKQKVDQLSDVEYVPNQHTFFTRWVSVVHFWNLRKKSQCKGSNIPQRKWKIHISSRRWTNKIRWRRSGTENIHLDKGPPNSRRRSKRCSRRIRRVSTSTISRLTSGCQWSTKLFLVHFRKLHIPPSRWTQSQTLLADRRIIHYSTEVHWRLQNYSYEFGCYAITPHRWLLEYRWIKRFVWFMDRFHSVYSIKWETSRRIYMVRGETDKTASDNQARSLWPELPRLWLCRRSWRFEIHFWRNIVHFRKSYICSNKLDV